MRYSSIFNSFAAALCCVLLPMTFGCHGEHGGHHDGHDHDEEMHDHEADGHDHEHAPGMIVLALEKARAAGVVVECVERGTFHDVIETSGSITAASCDETTIVATVSGVVSHARHISEGMAIGRGTVVYYVSSAGLQEGDVAQRARIAYMAAKNEYERLVPLAKDRIVTQRELNAAQREYENARVAYEAIGGNSTGRGVAVKAPVTGYMKECMVKDGDYVEVGDPLMVVTRNQHLYLRAEVPVRYYSSLSSIRSAKFRTQYSGDVFDLKEMNGVLLSSGKSAVSTSSYVPVTFQLDNCGGIVPGSYAEVFLIAGEREGVLCVPTGALTEEQGVYYVYVQMDEDCYRKQEVKTGATDGELTEITSGLKGGERVVTHGAINVKLAAASNVIPAHTHSH